MASEGTQPTKVNTGLKAYDDPMDFVQKNLANLRQANASHPANQGNQEAHEPEPQAVADTVKERIETEKAAQAVPQKLAKGQTQEQEIVPASADGARLDAPDLDPDFDPQAETPVTEEAKTSDNTEVTTDEGTEELTDSKEINFKKVRTKLSETTKALKEKEARNAELEAKIQAYETGAELPDVMSAKDEEIARLSRFEQLHSLKTSKAYKEAFITPIETAKAQLKAIAKDYGYPEGVIEQAINISNKAELNRFLARHFDEVGALEVKGVVSKIQDIHSQAVQAETAPAQELARLEAQHAEAIEQQRNQEKSLIAQTSKRAWVDALLGIRAEGKVHELIPREGDTEHNEKFVKPILAAAATEYGKLVRALTDSGLKSLNPDAAKQLAAICQRAAASGTAFASRDALIKELEGYSNNSGTRKYGRPALGGGLRGSAPAGETQTIQQQASKMSIKGAAQLLLDKVGA